MIGFLRGRLTHKQPPFLLLEVSGVGYELEAPMTTFYDLPEPQEDVQVSLFVHLVVREDAHRLFGFSDLSQRELFRSLLRVSGVGPRVALAILSTLSTAQFIHCIAQAEVSTLTKVPGIGGKTAQRIIFDMRDRIDTLEQSAEDISRAHEAPQNPVQDAISALLALGYKTADAKHAVHAIHDKGGRSEQLIRNALQYLSRA